MWWIEPDGSNAEQVVEDAGRAIECSALPWFERFADANEVLRVLLSDPADPAGTWGFGANPSPLRSYMLAYTARHLSYYELAAKSFHHILADDVMSYVHGRVATDLAALPSH